MFPTRWYWGLDKLIHVRVSQGQKYGCCENSIRRIQNESETIENCNCPILTFVDYSIEERFVEEFEDPNEAVKWLEERLKSDGYDVIK